jgi:hypothetical protein
VEPLERSIRRNLVSYLAGNAALDEFTSWLVRASWNVGSTGDVEASHLVYSIELALAEYSDGLLTLDELRAELLLLSRDVMLSFTSSDQRTAPHHEHVRRETGATTISPNGLQAFRLRYPSSIGTQFAAASW